MTNENLTPGSGKISSWLAITSTIVTIALTVLNTYWSNDIKKIDSDLKLRETELKAFQLELDAGKEKLARYTFVHKLFEGVLNQDHAQKSLTINLITLALTEKEATQLFSGLQVSADEKTREVGSLGSEIIALQGLVSQMNDVTKKNLLGAVEKLIKDHRRNPQAIDLSIKLIEYPKLEELSSSGRINVLVFLRNTDNTAWSDQLKVRAQRAIDNIRKRSEQGISSIGPQTQDELIKLESFLTNIIDQ